MDAFELVAGRDNAALQQLLADAPQTATTRNADGASLIAFATYCGNAEAVALLRAALPAIDPHDAIVIGDTARVREALAQDWDANTPASDGFTPLALAAYFGRGDIFDLLLPLVGDVNARARNSQQVAALHAAAARRDLRVAEKLLRAGADPNLPQQQGFVALHSAAMQGDSQLAGLLLLAGADPRRRDAAGKSAADHARENGHAWLAARLDQSAR